MTGPCLKPLNDDSVRLILKCQRTKNTKKKAVGLKPPPSAYKLFFNLVYEGVVSFRLSLSFPIVPTKSDDIEIHSVLITVLFSVFVIDHIFVNINFSLLLITVNKLNFLGCGSSALPRRPLGYEPSEILTSPYRHILKY